MPPVVAVFAICGVLALGAIFLLEWLLGSEDDDTPHPPPRIHTGV